VTEIWALVRKDLVSEWRSREVSLSAFVFSILAILIFSFAFGPDQGDLRRVVPGVLWLIFIFASILVLNASFSIESEEGGLEGVLMTPLDRGTIYLGKVLGNFIFIFLIDIIVLSICQFMLVQIRPEAFLRLILIISLGMFGITSVGTLFSAISANSRMREILLPILLLPVVVPVLIACVKATDAILNGGGDALQWVKVLIPFDAIYISVSSLAFDYVVVE